MKLPDAIDATIDALRSLLSLQTEIRQGEELILRALRGGHRLLLCGNGGSAAEAQHFATEMVGRFRGQRRSFPAVALSADGSLLSCIANDFGWDSVFVRQLQGQARPGDLLVVLSSSGQSSNLVAVLEEARRLGLPSLALLGRDGGPCRNLATAAIVVPGDETAPIQEAQLFLIHHFCRRIEEAFSAPDA